MAFIETPRERTQRLGRCTGPHDGAPAPGEVGLDYRAACRTCGKRVQITVRGYYAHHKKGTTTIEPVATKTKPSISAGQVHADWLRGSGCVRFSTFIKFGRGKIHRVGIEVSMAQIGNTAGTLRNTPSVEAYVFEGRVSRGKSWQPVPIPVPREMLIEIADALAGAVDASDAGHRFYHWESPDVAWPCSICRETRDADDARVVAARAQLVRAWTLELGVPSEAIERLLHEFDRLPRKALR